MACSWPTSREEGCTGEEGGREGWVCCDGWTGIGTGTAKGEPMEAGGGDTRLGCLLSGRDTARGLCVRTATFTDATGASLVFTTGVDGDLGFMIGNGNGFVAGRSSFAGLSEWKLSYLLAFSFFLLGFLLLKWN